MNDIYACVIGALIGILIGIPVAVVWLRGRLTRDEYVPWSVILARPAPPELPALPELPAESVKELQ